jgi:hypothetical protein
MSIYDYLSRFIRARCAGLSTPKDSWGFARYAYEQIDSVVVFGGVCAVRKRTANPRGLDQYAAIFDSALMREVPPPGVRENYAAYLIKNKVNLDRAIQLFVRRNEK